MSHWGDETWLTDLDADELDYIKGQVEDLGFWAYVDSQDNARPHPGHCRTETDDFGTRVTCSVWRHVRGEWCIAANSQLSQCGQRALPGIPFCGFHFDRAWKAILSFVTKHRVREVAIAEGFRRDTHYGYYDVDVAAVFDARRVLAAQPERVYFFAAGDAVKIGRSINPEQRVRSLGGTLAPEGVDLANGQLLGTMPGGHAVEHALHLRFRPHRLIGEWFALEAIRADIDRLLAESDVPLADTA